MEKIHILSNPGYIIKKVVINGEEIKIEPNQKEMTLEAFIQMKEDKKIEVEFMEEIKNPVTGSNILKLVIIILMGMGLPVYFILNGKFGFNRFAKHKKDISSF